MRVADIDIDRDHTLTLFCETDQTAKVDAMFAEIERLRDFVSYYARCPCCSQTEQCVGDCTFATDNPNAAEEMDQARAALKETK
jgi:hypothetical protein